MLGRFDASGRKTFDDRLGLLLETCVEQSLPVLASSREAFTFIMRNVARRFDCQPIQFGFELELSSGAVVAIEIPTWLVKMDGKAGATVLFRICSICVIPTWGSEICSRIQTARRIRMISP